MNRRRLTTTALIAGVLAVAGCGSSGSSSSSSTVSAQRSSSNAAGPLGPEGVPLEQGPPLASASTTTPGKTVDGIQCAPLEQLAYHIHVHLQVYVNGKPAQLPAAIGLIGPEVQQTPQGAFYGAQQCYYWLHTHATDGIIHIESPSPRIYTLGNFFDEWHQPLSSSQVGSAKGTVTASLNGKPWNGSPRGIPLAAHNVIQLDVGTPTVPAQSFSFGSSGL